MNSKLNNFIQSNSPDGGFLQSVYWKNFQESVGRKTHDISASDESGEPLVCASIITHTLPITGKYFYTPRGPVFENFKFQISNLKSIPNDKIRKYLNDLISLAEEKKAGWIRVEPNSEEELNLIRENITENNKIEKSAVDMQPREILILDISKNEGEILAQMKQKTRYNIKLAEKRGVKIYDSREEKYIQEFLRLVEITSKRDKITSHPGSYYRKMFETIPGDILKLYVAEFEKKIIAANLALFFEKTATYMHGASDNAHRNLMAPYLLQWRQIVDAKKSGCERYDFGGVDEKKWPGVTKFKTGFAPNVKPIQFPGCYDIILKPAKYNLYRALQRIKRIF
jgi:lipid II:glycine glycyltransferase (peptidoglycan interpeptide bridge formation enzyme)